MEGEKKLSSQIFHIFAGKDVSELTIIDQCQYLEAVYETNSTGEILTSIDSWRGVQKRILSEDKELRLKHSNIYQSIKYLSTIHSDLSWLKIWDMALDHGVKDPRAPLCLFGTLSRPLFGNTLCPRCETSIAEGLTYLEHLACGHPELELGTVEELTAILVSTSPDILAIGKRLMSSMPPS